MDVLTNLLSGFMTAITPTNLIACLAGSIMGTLTGILPGIGPSTAMALLIPFSFGLNPITSLIMLSGIYYGAMYGGSTTSILVNIPGEAASVVTCIDGHQMALKGRAGAALAVSAIGSFVAGTVGIIGLMLFAPKLANFALKFGPPEFFAIAFLGLVTLCNLVGKSFSRSLLMLLLGMMAATIGQDMITAYPRLNFGIPELVDGFDLVTVLMGIFGVGEILSVIDNPPEPNEIIKKIRFRELYPTKKELKKSFPPIVRGTFLGFLLGLLPGPASTIASFVSYKIEKSVAKNKDEFGKGAIEGVAGPESANNSACYGAMIPLFGLGLPFTPSVAILISALMMQGIIPGPRFITEHANIFWAVVASLYIGNVMLLILNLPFVGVFASLTKVSYKILAPIIMVIIFIGAYSSRNLLLDVGVTLFFGVLAYLLRKADFDLTPSIVGFVLGKVFEESLRQSLNMFKGSFVLFFTRPISSVFLIAALIVIFWRVVESWRVLFIRSKKEVNSGYLL
ncbi:hypothetical protein MHLNE_03150 [Moorella humiferrea]|uniref:tripartite tricarboxylate transporter permease n=1 Tax=Neomoorella humiferrea TaxID=676965 RepID=UPI0030D35807